MVVGEVREFSVHAEAAVMLREAREHIERVGWIKGMEKEPKTGAVCLHRALKDVDGTKHGLMVDVEARRIILKHIAKSIPSWNDAPERTKDDVITILLACEQMEKELAQ